MGQNQGMDVPVEGSGDVWRWHERRQTQCLQFKMLGIYSQRQNLNS